MNVGDMIGEVAREIGMGADRIDIGKIIHPRPTLGESIGKSTENSRGSYTDVSRRHKLV